MNVRERIAVVGASVSGLYGAAELARAGRRVVVYERAEALDPCPRTLIATARLRDWLPTGATRGIVHQVSRFEVFTDGRAATVSLKVPDVIVERAALIRDLAAHAESAGVELRWGQRLVGLQPLRRGVALTVEGRGARDFEADVVVGADGAASTVARAAGWPPHPTVPLLQAIVPLPAGMAADCARVWFRPQDTPYFYWLVPHSQTHGVLGVIGEGARTIRPRLDAFLAAKGLRPEAYQAARIPVYRRWRGVHSRLGGGDVFLVGDAAGHVKVSTVGGLVTGFRGAAGVVDVITGGSHRRLRALRRELDAHALIRRVLHGFSQDDYSLLVDLLNTATTRTLGRHTRDEAARVLARVAVTQPRLLGLAARALLTRGG